MSNENAIILLIGGGILFFTITGSMVAIGLKSAGNLLGISGGANRFACDCGHDISKHYTGRKLPPDFRLDEVGPCHKCGCPRWVSYSYRGY